MTTTQSESTERSSQVRWTVSEGRAVVAKSAAGRDRAALRYEAEVLGRLQLPGLLQLVELVDEDDRTTMLTVDAGRRSLARPVDLTAAELVRSLRRCVVAVGDLHAAGWSHGALRAEHALIGTRGRVRLCSLGSARPIDGADALASGVVGDLAQLVQMMDDVADLDVPAATWSERRRRRLSGGDLRRLATELRERPPTSTQEIGEALDALGLPGRLHASRRGIGRKGALVAIATVVIVMVGSALLTAGQPGARGGVSTSAAPTSTTLIVPPNSAVPTPVPVPTSAPVVVAGVGNEITVGATTYRLGIDGDVVAVGDRDCDGTALAVLLRPSTGEFFEFPQWASTTEPSDGRLVTTIAGARSVRAGSRSFPSFPVGRSCDRFFVTLHDGTEVDPFSDPVENLP